MNELIFINKEFALCLALKWSWDELGNGQFLFTFMLIDNSKVIFWRAFQIISIIYETFLGKKVYYMVDEMKKGMAKIFLHQECLIYLQTKA